MGLTLDESPLPPGGSSQNPENAKKCCVAWRRILSRQAVLVIFPEFTKFNAKMIKCNCQATKSFQNSKNTNNRHEQLPLPLILAPIEI